MPSVRRSTFGQGAAAELVVIDSDGGVYRGSDAFIMCLWAVDRCSDCFAGAQALCALDVQPGVEQAARLQQPALGRERRRRRRSAHRGRATRGLR